MREKLIDLRGDRSRLEVSEKLGITQQMLGAIERGDRNPSLQLAKKISDFYNTSVDDIFFSEKLQHNVSKKKGPAA